MIESLRKRTLNLPYFDSSISKPIISFCKPSLYHFCLLCSFQFNVFLAVMAAHICDLLLNRRTATWNLFVKYHLFASCQLTWSRSNCYFLMLVHNHTRSTSQANQGRETYRLVCRNIYLRLVFVKTKFVAYKDFLGLPRYF